MTFGGDGKGSGSGATTDLCNFMFPGLQTLIFQDRNGQRLLQVIYQLIEDLYSQQDLLPLEPGAVNTITIGVVWARAKSGGMTASVQLVKTYDRERRKLYLIIILIL